ncbi:MAG: hypothetical protein JWL85_924 [Candidatus Saccharibacteria bacterium]|nr:hypothetical protein [Candidatus Saccharibacteria bacterium]
MLREGDITLDEDETITRIEEMQRPLHVSGLLSRDVVVYLEVIDGERVAESIGYLVSHVDDEDGVIVPGNLVQSDPNTWLTDRVRNMINFLELSEFDQFTLNDLAEHVRGKAA